MNKTSSHVSPFFQVVTFCAASLLLIAIFYRPFVKFNSYDTVPSLLSYDDLNRSNEPIYTGLTIHYFTESDIINNSISIAATVWFAYNPGKVTREQIDNFSFDEATVEKSQINYTTQGKFEIASYDVQVHCRMDFDFREYPLDDHRLFFSLKNNALSLDKYHFRLNDKPFILGARASMNNCTAENIHAVAGFVKYDVLLPDGMHEVSSSRVVFSVDCNPIDMRHFLNIFLPLYLIFVLTLFAFSFGHNEHVTDVPGIAAIVVPALFAYRFIIESLSPNVSYFMISDHLFFLYLILSFLSFLSVSWGLNHSVAVKKNIIVGLYVLMLIGCAIIIYYI